MKNKLLLVEDDINFGAVLKSYLEIHDLQVEWVDDGRKAFPAFEKGNFDLVLLDIMLPNVDGFSIARKIKDSGSDVPFIFITAKTLREDIVEGYQTGADDYITKPFDSEIMLYKIKAILTRSTGVPNEFPDDIFTIGKFEFDHKARSLTEKATDIKKSLSPKESELLKLLAEHKGEVLPKTLALNKIWGDANYFTTRSMDVYIAKLRKFLSSDSSIKIVTLHGAGYRLIAK
jgi:DNA-binding response OmpR family regulator